MKDLHQVLKDGKCLFVSLAVHGLAEGRLDDLKVPPREIIPEELVCLHQRIGDAVPHEVVLYVRQCPVYCVTHPGNGGGRCRGLRDLFIAVHCHHQTEGVPYLVGEVASLFRQAVVIKKVISRR